MDALGSQVARTTSISGGNILRILLTGGNGFVGQHLLRSYGADVEVFSLVRQGRVFPEQAQSAAKLVEIDVDLSQPLPINRLPEQVDALVLLAQSNRYREFPKGAADMFAINTASVAQLLDYAVEAKVSSVVLASTGAVYEPFAGSLREDRRLEPSSYYAATKLAAEQLLNAYDAYFNSCALRLFFPFGAGQESRLIPDLISRIRDRRAIHLNGHADGNTLSPTYVDDVVRILNQAMGARWRGVFNVANPEPVSIRELSRALADELGIEPIFEQRPDAAEVHMVPELHELAARYDFSTFHSLREGLSRTVESR